MSKNHTGTSSAPYWLIREAGKKHGFGTLEFSGDTNADHAVARFMDEMEPSIRKGFEAYGTQVEAELVVLTYVNGDPVVCPVPVPA